MFAPTHILCPVDLSGHSAAVADAAAQLARQYGARLTLLTVVEDVFPFHEVYEALSDVGLPEVREKLRDLMEKDLLGLARRLAQSGVEPGTRVAIGNPVREILAVKEEIGADLIVLGRVGRGGLEGVLLGSVSEKVLRKARCHVLVVGADDPDGD